LPSLVSLATLKRRILQRTNLEGAVGRLFTSDELTDDINTSIARFYDEVRANTFNGGYYRSPYVFQTTPWNGSTPQNVNPPPNAIYALPDDFLALTSLDGFISPSVVLSCKAFQEEQRNMYRFWTGAVGWFLGTQVWYQIQGAGSAGTPYVVLMPPPQAQFSMQLNYTPIAPVLGNPDDTIDDINSWGELVVLDSCILLLMKCGRQEEIPQYAMRLEQERQRIRKLAPRRDQNTPERVHEVESYEDGWTY
jgi:hypothetical protein